MAKFPLDLEILYMEFPEIQRGLRSMQNPLTTKQEMDKLVRLKHGEIYDYIGIQEAFENTARYKQRVDKSAYVYENHLTKLERFMTAHLVLLYIYNVNQSINEMPSMTHYGKLETDKIGSSNNRSGNVFSILQGSNVGQRIQAMLIMNTRNIGGVL